MQISESEALGAGPRICVFSGFSRPLPYLPLKFKNQCDGERGEKEPVVGEEL